MIVRAFAKINLALRVGGRRADGYHELLTIFQSIDLADQLELDLADDLSLTVAAGAPPGEDNLVLRAARLLAREAGVRDGARMRLSKRIPAGGGLGGGSADAAATLVGLDRLWGLRAAGEDLRRMALALGSDVPYFLVGGTALGLGRGEELFALAELPARAVALALPGIELSTKQVFAALTGDRPARPTSEGWPLSATWEWREGAFNGLDNQLEAASYALHPELAAHRQELVSAGAEHARMSGSGSTSFGLFPAAAPAAAAVARLQAAGCPGVTVRTIDRATYHRGRWG